MRLDDLHNLTKEQLRFQDDNAKVIAERSLMEFSRALDVERRRFANRSGRDVLKVIFNKNYLGMGPDSFGYRNCFEKLLVAFAIGGYTPMLCGARMAEGGALQDVVDLCYFMACNGYAVKCTKPIEDRTISIYTSLDIGMETVSHKTMQNIMNNPCDPGIVFEKVSTGIEEIPTADLSHEFISYLENLGCVDFIVKELCDLQKAVPDVFDKLAHAWLDVQRGE